ncbi:MAG: hypothetical protein HQM16_16285 [Deltaproteobacteria bacterium]|nr:hypothetical protein [Deltaproteobacteria bacterium]
MKGILLALLILGSVLTGDKTVTQGQRDGYSLTERQNPFLMQVILKETRSVVDDSALDKLKRRAA